MPDSTLSREARLALALLRESPESVANARKGAPVGNSIVGQYAEQAVREALAVLDREKLCVLEADQVRLDERTDLREVIAILDEEACESLTAELRDGTAKVVYGPLLGWGKRNVTIRDIDGLYYHALVEGANP